MRKKKKNISKRNEDHMKRKRKKKSWEKQREITEDSR